ncbi:hypothetical protein DYB38_009386, partial [Aphanomyces astaci]
YFAHREITEFEQNFGNWRVYFAMNTIPQQLLCHGKSLAFVTVNGFSYAVFCKPSQFERGTRDKQSLDVDVILNDPTHDQSTNNAPSRPADLVPPLSGAEVDLDFSPNVSSDDQVSDVMPPTPPVATVAGDTDMASRNSERLVSFTPLVTTVPADLVGHLTTQRLAYLPGSKKRVSWDPNHMSLSDLVAVLETETNKANALDPTTLHTEAQLGQHLLTNLRLLNWSHDAISLLETISKDQFNSENFDNVWMFELTSSPPSLVHQQLDFSSHD